MVIVLDTTPLGLVTQRPGLAIADACRQWVLDMLDAGHRVVVPEIADYEVRRELVRAGKATAIRRLDEFNAAISDRYLPITTATMHMAAELWAQARNSGVATAHAHALDGDVILAAQALSLRVPTTEIVVASNNPRHISRFLAAELWENIRP